MKKILIMGLIVLGLILGQTGPIAAQERAPNRRDVVEQVSQADPQRFACAHTERSCKNDWIIAVAQALYKTDGRWGLNMKRDDDRQGLSMDVVTWRIGPTDRHVQAFDICGRCGGPNPSVEWGDITNWATLGNPGTARWIKPPQAVEPVDPVDPPTPVVDLRQVLAAINELKVKLDAVAGLALASRDVALDVKALTEQLKGEVAQINTTVLEIRHVDVPRLLEQFKPSCVTGKVPKAFGGSATVTLCPTQ